MDNPMSSNGPPPPPPALQAFRMYLRGEPNPILLKIEHVSGSTLRGTFAHPSITIPTFQGFKTPDMVGRALEAVIVKTGNPHVAVTPDGDPSPWAAKSILAKVTAFLDDPTRESKAALLEAMRGTETIASAPGATNETPAPAEAKPVVSVSADMARAIRLGLDIARMVANEKLWNGAMDYARTLVQTLDVDEATRHRGLWRVAEGHAKDLLALNVDPTKVAQAAQAASTPAPASEAPPKNKGGRPPKAQDK